MHCALPCQKAFLNVDLGNCETTAPCYKQAVKLHMQVCGKFFIFGRKKKIEQNLGKWQFELLHSIASSATVRLP